MQLIDVLRDFYAPMTGISDRTQALYEYTLRAFGDVLGRPAETADLEDLAVARFLASRVRSRSPATAAKDRAQLRAIWEFAARRRLVDTWPSLPRIIVPERVPEAWLTEELQAILDSARAETGTICGFPASAIYRAILLTQYWAGERIGAVMELKCADVRGCNIIFRAESRKGGRRDIFREVPVGCADALQAVRRGPGDTAIPWQSHPTDIYRRLKRILKRAGLPTRRQDMFHKVRKTAASYYEAGGGDAQKLMDHSSRKVTERYLDPRIVKRDRPASEVLPQVG
jgi:integrase